MSDVVSWSARAVLDAFAARTLSPVEYLNELFAQTDRVQPEVNALGDQYRDDALAAPARPRRGTRPARLRDASTACR